MNAPDHVLNSMIYRTQDNSAFPSMIHSVDGSQIGRSEHREVETQFTEDDRAVKRSTTEVLNDVKRIDHSRAI